MKSPSGKKRKGRLLLNGWNWWRQVFQARHTQSSIGPVLTQFIGPIGQEETAIKLQSGEGATPTACGRADARISEKMTAVYVQFLELVQS